MLWATLAVAVEPMVGVTIGMTTQAASSPFGRVYVGLDANVGLHRQWWSPHLTGGPLVEGRLTWLGRPSLAVGAMGSYRGTNFLLGTIGGDLEASYVFEAQRSGFRLGVRGHGVLHQTRVALNLGRENYGSFALGNAVERSITQCHGCVESSYSGPK